MRNREYSKFKFELCIDKVINQLDQVMAFCRYQVVVISAQALTCLFELDIDIGLGTISDIICYLRLRFIIFKSVSPQE